MSSLLSRLNVVPQFPPYKGPYTVASFELEIPVASLPASQRPPDAESISTVQFRVFYPTAQKFKPQTPEGTQAAHGSADGPKNAANGDKTKAGWTLGWFHRHGHHESQQPSKSVYWLPEPHQREYLSGYARFMGAGSGLAELISYIPRILHHIALPAISLAPLMPSKPQFKFPTMVFSHGLGGTRLAYSHLCGSLASYGMVVIAPEHRDGSAPVTFVKSGSHLSSETELTGTQPNTGEPGVSSASAAGAASPPRAQVDFVSYPHQISDETANGRNRQLEIRLWELSVIYAAIAQLDLGKIPSGTAMFDADGAMRNSILSAFEGKLDIREPGRLIWAGHSFGSATMIQMIKSVYYSDKIDLEDKPLFVPDASAPRNEPGTLPLSAQITDSSPLLLLDIWCLPLLSKRTRSLWEQPLPQIAAGNAGRVLAVMSAEFFVWRENLCGVRRVLSPDPGRRRGGKEHEVFEQFSSRVAAENAKHGETGFHPDNDLPTPARSEKPVVAPLDSSKRTSVRLFYVKESAHLSQSDFGILFPRAIKKAVDPAAILDLNVRAACQWLRESGFEGQLARHTAGGDVDATAEKLEAMQSCANGHAGDEEMFGSDFGRWAAIPLEDD